MLSITLSILCLQYVGISEFLSGGLSLASLENMLCVSARYALDLTSFVMLSFSL